MRSNKYQRILDYLAWRTGYENAWINKTNDCNMIAFTCEHAHSFINIHVPDYGLLTFLTYEKADSTVRYMLNKKNKMNLWTIKGPGQIDSSLKVSDPYVKLFKNTDTLESLSLLADLMQT